MPSNDASKDRQKQKTGRENVEFTTLPLRFPALLRFDVSSFSAVSI